MTRSRQVQMISRSRPVRAATGAFLRTLPGKRRVLPVVGTRPVVPVETQRMHVAVRRVRQREAIRRRMTGVLEMQRLRSARVDAHRWARCHIDEARRFDRPLYAGAIEGDGRRRYA